MVALHLAADSICKRPLRVETILIGVETPVIAVMETRRWALATLTLLGATIRQTSIGLLKEALELMDTREEAGASTV